VRLGDTRWRLRDDVVQLVTEPTTGRLLACDDHSVYLMDADTGEVLAEDGWPADHLSLAHGTVLASSYAVNVYSAADLHEQKLIHCRDDYPRQAHLVDGGRRVLVSTHEGRLVVIDRESGQRLHQRGIADSLILGMLVNTDTAFVLADRRVQAVSLDNLKPYTHWSHSSDEPQVMSLAPGGGAMAVGMESGEVVLLNLETMDVAERLGDEGHGPVRSMAHSLDGRLVAAGDEGGAVRVWRLSPRDCTLLLASNLPVKALAFSRDGARLAVGTGACIQWWDVEEGSLQNPAAGHIGAVRAIAFGDDGTMATMSRDSVRVWDLGSWRVHQIREASRGYDETFVGLAWAGDCYRLALGVGSRLRVQDLTQGRELLDVERERRPDDWVGLSPDGRTLAWTSCFDARLWSVPPDSGVAEGAEVELSYTVSRAWQPDGRALVVGNDRGHLTFCYKDGDKVRVRYRRGRISSLAVSADSRQVAVASPSYARKSAIGVWELTSGHRLSSAAEHTAHLMSFSGDGAAVAAANAQLISLMDAWQGEEFARWNSGDRWIHAVAFSPGERHLVVGLSSGTVLVWDLIGVDGPWSASRWCRRLVEHLRGRDQRRAGPYRSAPVDQDDRTEVHQPGDAPRVVLGTGDRALCLEAWTELDGFGLRLTEGGDPPSRVRPSLWQRLKRRLNPPRSTLPDRAQVLEDLEAAGLEVSHVHASLADGKRVVTLEVAALPPVAEVATLMEALLNRYAGSSGD